MANTDKFLDLQTGLPRLWSNVKDYVDNHSGGGGGGGHTNLTLTLASADWNTTTKQQSVTQSGVTADSLAILTGCSDSSVQLYSVSANTITFEYTSSSKPSAAVTAYVTVF